MQIRAIPTDISQCNTDWEAILSASRLQLLLALSSGSSLRRDNQIVTSLADAEKINSDAGQQLGSLAAIDKMSNAEFDLALNHAVSLFKPDGLIVSLNELQAEAVSRLLTTLVAAQAALGAKSSAAGQVAAGPSPRSAQQLVDTFQLLAVAAMRGRGPTESISIATNANVWWTARRVSLDGSELDSGSLILKNTCNSSSSTGPCSNFEDFAFSVSIPSIIRESIKAQYKDQAPNTIDIVVTVFAPNLFAFSGSSTTYGPSIRITIMRALDRYDPSAPAFTVSGLSTPIKASWPRLFLMKRPSTPICL